jgi:dihydroxy-acid dehydratase
MTALYLERYTNYGISVEELQSDRPIIGIAQSGSDISPCNRHHLVLAHRLREGIREAGGIPMEFPTHPIQETGKRPTAALDRNLSYLSLVEVLFGYPLDGVVMTIGCDKTTPAALMAAATVDIPTIALSVGPMVNGWKDGRRIGSGTIIWEAREQLATGRLTYREFIELVTASTRSTGFCNTMGTATTMNSLTEVLGMSLPGSAAIPAPYREREECAYRTGLMIVEMVHSERRPSNILTRAAFVNAIRVCAALGGSTNAPIHVNAIARHAGVTLTLEDWQKYGEDVPLLVNLQPAGEYLGEDFFRAGGVPAVVAELMRIGLINQDALTVNGKTLGDNCQGARIEDAEVIRSADEPLKESGGFMVMSGNIFDSAIMKTSVISDGFQKLYLSNPDDPFAFEGHVLVFDGPEDYHARIDDPALKADQNTILVIRGVGPVGYPGSAEVVNMRPPSYLLAAGIHELPCIGDGRQSGTSAAPAILNVTPEAAVGGGLALLQDGDRVRVDLAKRRVDVCLADEVLAERRRELNDRGGYLCPESQTPWQEMQREKVGQMDAGAVLEPAVKYRQIAQTVGTPRHSH